MSIVRNISHRLLIFIAAIASAFAFKCHAQDFAKIDPNLAVTVEYFTTGMKYLASPDSYKPLAEYANGDTKLLCYKGWVYDFKYCLMANPKAGRLFFGFVDYTNPDVPRLMFGTIIEKNEGSDRQPKTIAVRFDMDIDLITYLKPQPPKGEYNFGDHTLDYRCADPTGSNKYKLNTAYGLVAETASGFYCQRLSWCDLLNFNSNGRGTAIQHATAEGREEYLSSSDRRGPRGGYKGTKTENGAVKYSVIIDRTQPMSWTLSDTPDGKWKLLKLNYTASSTPKIRYEYATPHSVMTEIKNSYAKWARSAPLRYVGSEEFIYCGKLEKWMVIRKVESDWLKADSYIFVPVAGFQIETKSYLDPSRMIKIDVTPDRLAMDMVNKFIK